MNRITARMSQLQSRTPGQPSLRAERRLQLDVERMLRDMAFVLKMTQRVKAEILAANSANESLAV